MKQNYKNNSIYAEEKEKIYKKKKKNRWYIQETRGKMADVNTIILIITLSVSVLSISTKSTDFQIDKKRKNIMLSTLKHFKI